MTNRYGGKCADCGKYVRAGEGEAFKSGSKWQARHVSGGCLAERPAMVAPTYQLTAEQVAAVALFAAGTGAIAIEAGAGTGKTSTLRAMAATTSEPITYTAFNRAAVSDGERSFPAHVTCATRHALAYRAVGRQYAARLKAPRLHPAEVARLLGLEALTVTLPNETRTLTPRYLASLTMAGIGRYCASADRELSTRHVPYVDGLDGANDAVAAELLPAMRRGWADLTDRNGKLRFGHDHYFKIWALGEPVIPGRRILVDEAQDTPPVFADVLERQAVPVVYVGDTQQGLYDYLGAINALARVNASERGYLTTSFRFGAGIAEVANAILELIDGAQIRISGAGPVSTVGPCSEPRAVLTRTNAGAIAQILAATEQGRSAHLVGGGADVLNFARAAKELQRGQTCDHPELGCFADWAAVQDFAENDPMGEEIRLMVRLIDKYGADVVAATAANTTPEDKADVVVSTVHKAKGREWDSVKLGGDFPALHEGQTPSAQDLRLLYVAATRARKHLDYTSCEPLRQIRGEAPRRSREEDAA